MIEREDELGLMRRIIDKVHRMVVLRHHADFDEGEKNLLSQLFGDYENKPLPPVRTRWARADSDLL